MISDCQAGFGLDGKLGSFVYCKLCISRISYLIIIQGNRGIQGNSGGACVFDRYYLICNGIGAVICTLICAEIKGFRGDLQLPYSLIDRIRERAEFPAGKSITRDRFESKIAARGVYAPVLWPIDAKAAEVCENAAYFAQNMLAFYIDHRYTTEQIRHAADMFLEELDILI